MEIAKQIHFVSELYSLEDKYSRIYFGNQFCTHLFPNSEQLSIVNDFCKENAIELTIVMPYMVEENITKFIKIMDFIEKRNIDCELVINDWGILDYIKMNYDTKFKLVLGNLLNKAKKSPVIDNIFNKLNNDQREAFCSCYASSEISYGLLKSYGIYRVEFENMLQGNYIKKDFPFEKTLHFPYVFITTARKCITDFVLNDKKGYDIEKCSRSCFKTQFVLSNEIWDMDLILKGNTFYYENVQIPDNISMFSRVVIDTLDY